MTSPFSPEEQAVQGARRKTHRGRRSRGKGPKPDAMTEANEHIKRAHADPTPKGTTAHLFKALRSLHAAKPKD